MSLLTNSGCAMRRRAGSNANGGTSPHGRKRGAIGEQVGEEMGHRRRAESGAEVLEGVAPTVADAAFLISLDARRDELLSGLSPVPPGFRSTRARVARASLESREMIDSDAAGVAGAQLAQSSSRKPSP
jgi:hypothetical protein